MFSNNSILKYLADPSFQDDTVEQEEEEQVEYDEELEDSDDLPVYEGSGSDALPVYTGLGY